MRYRRRIGKGAGFTLVELMVAVAIIGVLVLLGAQKMQVYKIRAHRAEAKVNLKSLQALVVSYGSLSDLPVTAAAGPSAVQASWYPVVFDDTSTPTSCNSPNVFGFVLSSCTHARYSYWYISSGGNDWAIGAWNNGKICQPVWEGEALVYCPSTKEIRQVKDAALNNCAAVWTGSPFGCQGKGD